MRFAPDIFIFYPLSDLLKLFLEFYHRAAHRDSDVAGVIINHIYFAFVAGQVVNETRGAGLMPATSAVEKTVQRACRNEVIIDKSFIKIRRAVNAHDVNIAVHAIAGIERVTETVAAAVSEINVVQSLSEREAAIV